ncbi:MAG: FecR family protein [Verrucomicrobiales bacterium]
MRLFGRFSKFVGLTVAMAAFLFATAVEAKDNHAVVRRVSGSANYSTDNGASWKKLNTNSKLNPNSVVRTAPGSTVDLFLGDNGPLVRVTEDTTLGLDRLSSEGTGVEKVIETELNLKNGRILGHVKKLAAASRYEVKTPVGVAGIRGTQYDISANGDVTVLEGTVIVVYILPNGQTTAPVTVNAGQTVRAPAPGAQPVVANASPSALAAIRTAMAGLGSAGSTTGETTGSTTGTTVIPDVRVEGDPVRERKIFESREPNLSPIQN